jgi:hypothetical protein
MSEASKTGTFLMGARTVARGATDGSPAAIYYAQGVLAYMHAIWLLDAFRMNRESAEIRFVLEDPDEWLPNTIMLTVGFDYEQRLREDLIRQGIYSAAIRQFSDCMKFVIENRWRLPRWSPESWQGIDRPAAVRSLEAMVGNSIKGRKLLRDALDRSVDIPLLTEAANSTDYINCLCLLRSALKIDRS